MAHKTLIGGTAYEISGGKTLVNGTITAKMGKITAEEALAELMEVLA